MANYTNTSHNTLISGNATADSIYNNGGNYVTINGGAGNDTITNYGYGSGYSLSSYYGSYALIDGGAGDDKISLSSGSRYAKVVYAAGDGNDTIYGLDSNDTLQITGAEYSTVASGNDLILGVGNDSILIVGGANTYFSIDGTLKGYIYNSTSNTIIAGSNEGDTIYNSYANNVTISAGTGDDSIYNYSGDNVSIDAGDGNDTITNYGYTSTYYNSTLDSYYTYYSGQEATINGGAGNDLVSLSSGSRYSKVVYAAGDGNDTVYGLDSNDTLQISGSAYTTTKSGNNLILGVGDDSILVVGGANNSFSVIGSLINVINGTENADRLRNESTNYTSINAYGGNDYIYNSKDYVTIDAGTGNNTVDNTFGDKVLIFAGTGDDSIRNRTTNNVTIDTGAGNDTIYTDGEQVTINAGTGNDIITRSTSNQFADIFIQYAAGDGNDTIYNATAYDTIQITGAEYSTVASGNDLIIRVGTDSIFVSGGANVAFTIDGTLGSGGNDSGGGSSDDSETLTGTARADTLTNAEDDFQIDALAGNDKISNSGSNVTINGGKGNDTILNSGENILYQYANGEGKDIISGFTENDTLQIISGTIKNSVVSGADLILTIGTGSITLKDIEGGTGINILNADGTTSVISVPKILQGTAKADSLTNAEDDFQIDALAGNDKIINSGSNVTISGGKGNDTISNSGENILYQYANGEGKDIISGFTENDTLQITKGTIKNSVVSGADFILTIGTGAVTLQSVAGSAITLIDEKGNASTFVVPYVHTLTTKADSFTNEDDGYKVAALAGNDSIENYAAQVTIDGGDGNDEIFNIGNDASIFGGKGNDSIDNFADNVTINGGKGNDYIFSAGEENIFQYATGDGKDSIFGFSENDSIHITDGKLKNATVKGMDVILNIGSGSITLEDSAGKNINILDSAGTLTTTLLSGSWEGTSKADTYENSQENLSLKAYAGNDKITNYAANITIDGGAGHDRIYLEDGENVIVIGGKGNDTITNSGGEFLYQYATGDGKDVIFGFTENDSLQITKGSVISTTISGNDTILKIGSGSVTLKDFSDSVNIIGGTNSKTLDILQDNNFISDDTQLSQITENKFAVTQFQPSNNENLAQDCNFLTFDEEK